MSLIGFVIVALKCEVIVKCGSEVFSHKIFKDISELINDGVDIFEHDFENLLKLLFNFGIKKMAVGLIDLKLNFRCYSMDVNDLFVAIFVKLL